MRGNLNQIMVKENLEEDLTEEEEIILEKDLIEGEEIILEKDLTGEEGIIMEKGLTGEEGIIMEKDLTEEEGIILEKDLTGEEESQPTKKVVDEVSMVILLINLRIRALGTVVENHLVKDSSA